LALPLSQLPRRHAVTSRLPANFATKDLITSKIDLWGLVGIPALRPLRRNGGRGARLAAECMSARGDDSSGKS
jgi:hypothetical protein